MSIEWREHLAATGPPLPGTALWNTAGSLAAADYLRLLCETAEQRDPKSPDSKSLPFRDFRSARTDVERELDSWLTRIENTRSIGTSCAATTTDDPWRSRPRTDATGSAATSRRPVVHPSQFDAQFCSARFICPEDEPGLPELLANSLRPHLYLMSGQGPISQPV